MMSLLFDDKNSNKIHTFEIFYSIFLDEHLLFKYYHFQLEYDYCYNNI